MRMRINNPYPKQEGFDQRVKYAFCALCHRPALLPSERGTNADFTRRREFDDCFENGDSDAVVWSLINAAFDNPSLSAGIQDYSLKTYNQWLEFYFYGKKEANV